MKVLNCTTSITHTQPNGSQMSHGGQDMSGCEVCQLLIAEAQA